MNKFNITETFTKNGKSNVHKYEKFEITKILKWDEGPFINMSGDTFPDIDIENIPISKIPAHMIVQIRDDKSNRDGLLSVVKGDSPKEEYDKLYNQIKLYVIDHELRKYIVGNQDDKFLYKYERTYDENTYKYTLEMERCDE